MTEKRTMSGRIRQHEAVVNIKYPYLCSDRDRHGKVRIYYRRKGRKVRLHAAPGTPEFQAEYDAAGGLRVGRPVPDTYHGLVQRYITSPEFHALDATTQRQKRRVLESTCLEPYAPGSDKIMADCPLKISDGNMCGRCATGKPRTAKQPGID